MSALNQELLEALARDFSVPREGQTGAVLAALSANRLAALRSAIYKAAQATGESWPEQLVAFTIGHRGAWCPESGIARRELTRGNSALAALQWAFAAAGSGGTGDLTVFFDSPCELFFEGRIFEADGHVRLTSDGTHIELHVSGATRELVLCGEQWESESDADSRWPLHYTSSIPSTYMVATDMSLPAGGTFPWPGAKQAGRAIPMTIPPSLEEALSLLNTHAHEQARWVQTTMKGLLVIEKGLSPAHSCSDPIFCGLVAIAPPACPISCAEILVQEASRQQMFAYMTISAMTDESCIEAWYSPISRIYLSSLRLLSDAHIHANTILLYRALSERIKLDQHSQDRYLRAKVLFNEQCRPALVMSKSLSMAGGALWSQINQAFN